MQEIGIGALKVEQRSHAETARTARIAGALYAALGVATAFGFYHAPLLYGDPASLARVIAVPDLRFRIAVLSDVLAAALAVPLCVVLYRLFEPVDRSRSALMALLLLVSMPISFVLAMNYVAAHALLTGASETISLSAEQRQALAMLFLRLHIDGVSAVEIFWGLWLFPLGTLVIRSRYAPRLLGLLLIIAGVAYVAHSVLSLVLPGPRNVWYERLTMAARGAGEFPIILWLLFKGASREAEVAVVAAE